MRTGSPVEWSRAFGVGPDDLPDEIRRLLRAADAIDGAAVYLQYVVNVTPDKELADAVLQLQRASAVVVGHLRRLLGEA